MNLNLKSLSIIIGFFLSFSAFANTPEEMMIVAIHDDNPAEILQAVAAGADVNTPLPVWPWIIDHSFYPIVYAASEGKVEAVKSLLALGANPNSHGSVPASFEMYSALHMVACSHMGEHAYENREIVANILLKAGADPEIAARGTGWTPILCAAYAHNIEVAKILINAGANIDQLYVEADSASNDGDFAIGLASSGLDYSTSGQGTSLAMTHFLVGYGVNVNQANLQGTTALHYAAYYGKSEVIQYLLLQGANVNAISQRNPRYEWQVPSLNAAII